MTDRDCGSHAEWKGMPRVEDAFVSAKQGQVVEDINATMRAILNIAPTLPSGSISESTDQGRGER